MDEAVAAEPKSEVELLREEVAFLKICGIIEIAVRNPSVAEYMTHWEDRAEKAEAQVEALRTQLDEALEKLQPFAMAAEDLDESNNDDDYLWESAAAMGLSAGDLRAAAAFILSQPA